MLRDGAHLLLFRRNKKEIFLVYRSDYPIWGTTGGGIEKNETPRQAALREAGEETGFKVEIIKAIGETHTKDEGGNYISYLFEGRVISGNFRPEFEGCKGEWFDVDKLPLSMTRSSKNKIYDCLNNKNGYFIKRVKHNRIRENWHLFLIHPISSVKYFFK